MQTKLPPIAQNQGNRSTMLILCFDNNANFAGASHGRNDCIRRPNGCKAHRVGRWHLKDAKHKNACDPEDKGPIPGYAR